jgi:hypothetical protein
LEEIILKDLKLYDIIYATKATKSIVTGHYLNSITKEVVDSEIQCNPLYKVEVLKDNGYNFLVSINNSILSTIDKSSGKLYLENYNLYFTVQEYVDEIRNKNTKQHLACNLNNNILKLNTAQLKKLVDYSEEFLEFEN